MLGASARRGTRAVPLPRGVGAHGSFVSQTSAHVARHEVAAGRSATRLKMRNRAARGELVVSSVDVRSAPGKLGAAALWQGRCRLEARASAVSKRERTRKEMSRHVARHAPHDGAERRGFPGWVARKGTTARRVPDDSPARGKGSELEHRFVPARQNSGCRLRHRTPPASRARKQSERLVRGGQPGWRRKTRTGSCSERRRVPFRRKASRIAASRPFHEGRGKRSRSNGHHASRPAKAEA